MENSKNTLKYLCIGLAIVVVILIVVVAYLLGLRNGEKRNAGKTGADPAGSVSQDADAAAVDAPRNLEIELAAGDLDIVQGDAFHVQYDESVIRVNTAGDSMKIETKDRHPSAGERRKMKVTITVPEACVFGNVDIEMGAGEMNVTALSAGNLELQLGAGSVTLNNLFIGSAAKIEGGAGEFSVKSGEINNLTLECGAGAANVAAKLTGNSRIDSAIGQVDLRLDGTQEDYTVSFGVGLGACYYNGDQISRSGSFGEGPNRVTVNGGLGMIHVNVG